MAAEMLSMEAPNALERAAEIIRRGGVVAVPTETFYGLAADASNERAAARIYEIKGRPESMALPLVAAGVDQIEQMLGPLDARSAKAAARFWPGPLSLVLGPGNVAVRVPAHELVRALCRETGALLTATSANRTGEPPADTAAAVAASIGSLVDLVIDGGTTPGGKPSTIADLRGAPRLIRDGAIAWDVINGV